MKKLVFLLSTFLLYQLSFAATFKMNTHTFDPNTNNTVLIDDCNSSLIAHFEHTENHSFGNIINIKIELLHNGNVIKTESFTHSGSPKTYILREALTLEEGDYEIRYTKNESLAFTQGPINIEKHCNIDWFISYDADGIWTTTFPDANLQKEEVLFGDFTNDGKTDIFNANGITWGYSDAGTTNTQFLRFESIKTEDLMLGDFNGDLIADVFYADGTNWYVSYGGTSPLTLLTASSYTKSHLAIGYFNNDNIADVFLMNGVDWKVSHGGTGAWITLKPGESLLKEDLMFGDFNGDQKTDVMHANGTDWMVSYGGTNNWSLLTASGYTKADLMIGKFDGNNKSDVFLADGVNWRVSHDGIGGWQTIASSDRRKHELALGNFDSDETWEVWTFNTTTLRRKSAGSLNDIDENIEDELSIKTIDVQGLYQINSSRMMQKLEVYNLNGQKVYQEGIGEQHVIDIRKEVSGIYIVRVFLNDKAVSKKIIKH